MPLWLTAVRDGINRATSQAASLRSQCFAETLQAARFSAVNTRPLAENAVIWPSWRPSSRQDVSASAPLGSEVLWQPELLQDQITDPATKSCLEAALAGVAVQAELAKAGEATKATAAATINDFTNELLK
jgi:hypothetical protein